MEQRRKLSAISSGPSSARRSSNTSNNMNLTRRQFLQTAAAAGVTAALPSIASAAPKLTPTADSMVLIWLPGGIAQTDTWDHKKHTPYERGMKGDQLLGTCPALPTSVDGITFGQGLENMAMAMDK